MSNGQTMKVGHENCLMSHQSDPETSFHHSRICNNSSVMRQHGLVVISDKLKIIRQAMQIK